MIVNYYHEINHHVAGQDQTLANISQRFWILENVKVLRECENNCYGCTRRKTRIEKQIMVPFPATRLKHPLRAFSKLSVEYGGPFHVEEVKEKIGICAFLHVYCHVLCT